MEKHEFIEEINRTIKGINLTDESIEYVYKDTSNLHELSDNSGAAVGRLTAKVTITYNGKTKTYPAEDVTTFPCKFIDDYNNGYYSG